MHRLITLLLLFTLVASLSASMDFCPQMTLVEMGADNMSNGQSMANTGMNLVEDDFNHNELASIRYYHGEYGSTTIDEMLALFDFTTYPTLVFDRDAMVASGDATGALYLTEINDVYWNASPVLVQVTQFDAATGDWSADFTMYDEDLTLINTPVQIVLFEDVVDTDVTHVARAAHIDAVNLSGSGFSQTLTGSFDVSGFNTANLHLLAVICDEQGGYLNAATDMMGGDQPDLQPAIPFDRDVVGPSWTDTGNYSYDGEFFGLVNYGADAAFEANLTSENVPDGMSVMYCFEDSEGGSGCYNPSAGPFAFSLAHGDWIMFHLLIPQVTQACSFDYQFTFGSTTDRPDPLVIPFTFTTAELGVGDGAPALSQLGQNRPNPFNPTTTIAFSLAQPGFVSLDVYDVRGRLVRTLVNDDRLAGEHSVVWDGCDDSGSEASSGVYFYRLRANGETSVKRMALLK